VLSLISLALAASFDPDFRWSTIKTEHFDITFHQGEEQIAAEMAVAAEDAWRVLVEELDIEKRGRVQLALVDHTDSANGYATTVPNNQIVIFVTAPQEDSSLALYSDWSSAIVTHELTHVLHLGTVSGLPKVASFLFGKIIAPNLLAPGWITEGFATFEETRHTPGGRGRSKGVDMVKRTAWLEGKFPSLDTLDGYQALPPSGNLRYVFGQDFIQFIADKTGSQKWTEWVHRYGASIPYILHGKKTFGSSLYQLHQEWVEAVGVRYRTQIKEIEAQGLTPWTPISDPAIGCGAASYSPDGKTLAFGCSDPKTGSGIRLWGIRDGKIEEQLVLKGHSPRNLIWRPDGKALVFTELHTADLYNTFEDIYLYDLSAKKLKQLTFNARAHDPTFAPDGSRLLVVTNGLQNNQLAELTVDGRLTPLTANKDHTQYGTPRYSPDGKLLAVSVWQGGTRDLWLFMPDGTPFKRLTQDMAIERDPAWSPDGKYLYFTSDRTGVPNIFVLKLDSFEIFQISNVVTGAYGPSPNPDGTKLAYEVFTSMGGRIVWSELKPELWRALGKIPEFPGADKAQPEASPAFDPLSLPFSKEEKREAAKESREKAKERPEEVAGYPVKPYNPWPLAFPPRFWLPSGYLTYTGDSWGLLGYAATGGSDPLRHILWSAYASYRTDADFIGGGGSFTVNRWRTVFGVAASSRVSPYGTIYAQTEPPSGGPYLPGVESTLTRYWDHRISWSASAGYPLSTSTSVLGYYQGTIRQPLDPLPEDVYTASLPTRGLLNTIGAGWTYSRGSYYTLSISPEQARVVSVGAEITPSLLGSYVYDEQGQPAPFNQLQVSAQWREYRTNPWIPNHVFAARAVGGATIGDGFRYGSYRLGGAFSQSGVTVVPDEWRSLRGFYPATDTGEWFWMGSGEYRFPIWRVDRGLGALPIFLRFISGTVLVDAGNAFDDASGLMGQPLVGLGGELNSAWVLGWGGGMYLRAGYAFAALGEGIPLGSLSGGYLSLGSSF
jgi:WD40 repeat protein